MAQQPMIRALTGLRALAAGWVVTHHVQTQLFGLLPALEFLRPVTEAGWLGVEIFFVLSGFIIAHTYADRVGGREPGSWTSFWWARVARIYPVHLFTVVLMVAAVSATGDTGSRDGRYSWVNVVGNIFLLQSFPGFRGVNWPSWSICCEAVAYLVFPLLATQLVRLSTRQAVWGLTTLLCSAGAATVAVAVFTTDFWPMNYPVMWARIAVEFPLGGLVWLWWRRCSGRSPRWDVAAAGAALVIVVVAYGTGRESAWTLLALPAIVLFVVSCASASGPVGAALGSRIMVWGGRISYSLYMTHFIVLIVANRLIQWREWGDAPLYGRVLLLSIVGVAMLGAAAATFYLVEEPGRHLMNRISPFRQRAERHWLSALVRSRSQPVRWPTWSLLRGPLLRFLFRFVGSRRCGAWNVAPSLRRCANTVGQANED